MLDCRLSYGPRRPDWTQTGAPTPAEMSAMLMHREQVLYHRYPSMLMATMPTASVQIDQPKPAPAKPPIPAPPNLPRDHELITSGAYR